MECPESLEELEELEKLIPLCKVTLYNQAKARVDSGAANSYRDASRQLATETGRSSETIRTAIDRGKVASLTPGRPPWTGQFESYTPKKYIESARVVMGGINLDPASCEVANKTIQADKYFNLDSDGLKQKWFGKVFLNPPYKQPTIEDFITKLVEEYVAGDVTEAILLTNNSTDTNWFRVASAESLICFTDHRVRFELEDGQATQPTTGQAFYYFGHHKQNFIDEFRNHGLIFERK